MKQLQMDHDGDPKQKLIDEVGDLSQIEIFNNQILAAVYIRPEKTKSGLYLSDKYRDEDKYQSKVGLILKKGPSAFVDDDGKWFSGLDIKEGDWIVFRPSDGWNVTINGTLCRMLDDMSIRARISHPDQVW